MVRHLAICLSKIVIIARNVKLKVVREVEFVNIVSIHSIVRRRILMGLIGITLEKTVIIN